MKGFLKGLAWVVWWIATRSACAACAALAWVYGMRGGILPTFAWIGLAGVVVVLIVLVEDE